MSEGVHSKKGGYACLDPSEEFGRRERESVKQDYDRGGSWKHGKVP